MTSRRFRCAALFVTGAILCSAAVAQHHLVTVRAAAAPLTPAVPPPVSSAAPPRVSAAPAAAVATVGRDSDAGPPEAAAAPAHAEIVVSPTDGVIGQLFVTLGEHVKPGQTLATILSDESHSLLAHFTLDVEHARQQTRGIQRSIELLDADLTAARAEREAAVRTAQQRNAEEETQMQAALAHAPRVYTEAVARERRAAVLDAHGISAAQELEEAQMAVRSAATELANLRRTLDAAAAAGTARMREAQTELELAVAERERQREERTAALLQAEQRQRDAERQLASGRLRFGTRVRARLEGRVTGLPAGTGRRIAAGDPLATISVNSRVGPH